MSLTEWNILCLTNTDIPAYSDSLATVTLLTSPKFSYNIIREQVVSVSQSVRVNEQNSSKIRTLTPYYYNIDWSWEGEREGGREEEREGVLEGEIERGRVRGAGREGGRGTEREGEGGRV